MSYPMPPPGVPRTDIGRQLDALRQDFDLETILRRRAIAGYDAQSQEYSGNADRGVVPGTFGRGGNLADGDMADENRYRGVVERMTQTLVSLGQAAVGPDRIKAFRTGAHMATTRFPYDTGPATLAAAAERADTLARAIPGDPFLVYGREPNFDFAGGVLLTPFSLVYAPEVRGHEPQCGATARLRQYSSAMSATSIADWGPHDFDPVAPLAANTTPLRTIRVGADDISQAVDSLLASHGENLSPTQHSVLVCALGATGCRLEDLGFSTAMATAAMQRYRDELLHITTSENPSMPLGVINALGRALRVLEQQSL